MYLECLDYTRFTQIDAHGAKTLNPCTREDNQRGELVELGKVGSHHVRILNIKIHPDES